MHICNNEKEKRVITYLSIFVTAANENQFYQIRSSRYQMFLIGLIVLAHSITCYCTFYN